MRYLVANQTIDNIKPTQGARPLSSPKNTVVIKNESTERSTLIERLPNPKTDRPYELNDLSTQSTTCIMS